MQAGKMKFRITVKTPSGVSDGMGGRSAASSTLGVFWADIEPLKGKRLERAQQIDSEANVLVTMRYNKNITPAHTLEYASQKYRILSIINTGNDNRSTEIYCTSLMSERTV